MIESALNGLCLKMYTKCSLFSPNHIDRGIIAMISKIEFQTGQKILDLSRGYGVIAAALAGGTIQFVTGFISGIVKMLFLLA